MTYEQIREVLETKYTHVTFIRTFKGFKGEEITEWTIGEDMECIFIGEPVNIIENIELNKVFHELGAPELSKWNAFKQAARKGLIEITAKAYKRTTLNKLSVLLGYDA